jgi:urease subunit beta
LNQEQSVVLVEFGGSKEIHGFNGLTNGSTDQSVKTKAIDKMKKLKFRQSK